MQIRLRHMQADSEWCMHRLASSALRAFSSTSNGVEVSQSVVKPRKPANQLNMTEMTRCTSHRFKVVSGKLFRLVIPPHQRPGTAPKQGVGDRKAAIFYHAHPAVQRMTSYLHRVVGNDLLPASVQKGKFLPVVLRIRFRFSSQSLAFRSQHR